MCDLTGPPRRLNGEWTGFVLYWRMVIKVVGVEEKGDGTVVHFAEFNFPFLSNYNSLGFFLFAVLHIKKVPYYAKKILYQCFLNVVCL